jgi:putative MATE family efflux protein
LKKVISLFLESLRGEENNFTTGSIRLAIFMLSVPMVLEMLMESLFAVVDIFFVARVSTDAVATVGLTESVLTLIYSVAWGISLAATSLISRRIGENNPEAAGHAAAQTILLSFTLGIFLGLPGVIYAEELLRFMGGSEKLIQAGAGYTRIVFTSTPIIVLLYSLGGVLRGAGNAATSMRALWIANAANMLLDPLFIFGLSFVPGFGVMGAAIATSTGRTIGVAYQLYKMSDHSGAFSIKSSQLVPDWQVIRQLLSLSFGTTFQFLIGSASWVFLNRIVASFGSDVTAGYTIAIRIIIFTIMPAWGMANAAATLTGQNLGANQPERAEKSVWQAAYYNLIFMVTIAVLFFIFAKELVLIFDSTPSVVAVGVQALRIICLGYFFYPFGMVLSQAFNGAGDTRTPLVVNIICFWIIEIPLAYALANFTGLQANGVYASIAIAESIMAVILIVLFKRGNWKKIAV